VNSEELEQSLRSEFENYFKNFRAELQQETAELQKRLGEAFEAYSARFGADGHMDEAFTSTVIEHLRLARDEGARLTATALAEAEQMQAAEQPAPADYSSIRDAVADISAQTSQSAILKSLVTRAADFAPRGAFFIIKAEQLVGWKVVGPDGDSFDDIVHDVHFPAAADTILGRAVASMTTVDSSYGAHAEDQGFLGPLQFGQPDRMYAIPLVARGRGVAVLYADGVGEGTVNVEALETLVRVAGMTVELLAATQSISGEAREGASSDLQYAQPEVSERVYEAPQPEHVQETQQREPEFAFSDGSAAVTGFEAPAVPTQEPVHETERAFEPVHETEHQFEPVQEVEHSFEPVQEPEQQSQSFQEAPPASEPPAFEQPSFEQPSYQQPAFDAQQEDSSRAGQMVFDSGGSIEPAVEKSPSPFETAAQPSPAGVGVIGGVTAERSIQVSPQQTAPTRLRDRNVDLPIDVDESERRLHNDARRFARLLVSEIKLYNEKKVQEGRQANDLYERLREAIDRSREMYDKRVQPAVAAKFDYFHYELVNALADGNVEHLGNSYPGSTV
jgi:hypothetical protein